MKASPRGTARTAAREPIQTSGDTIYTAPSLADWMWLAIFALVISGCGAYVWFQLGEHSRLGQAAFAGSLLIAGMWAALMYALKLSTAVTLSSGGISVVRGPWRTELVWAEVDRMTERVTMEHGQRFRWLLIYALDGRCLSIREDMVADYARFRVEVYQRFKDWEDHGGTWGTTRGGPYSAEDDVRNLITWWLAATGFLALPGIYAIVFVDGGLLVGILLTLAGLACAGMTVRAWLGRQLYSVDAHQVTAKRPLSTVRLSWSEVARVERSRSKVSLLYRLGIIVGRIALALAARADARIEAFPWQPRVPEYLTLRGAGHHIRIRLHRVASPDELLAWISFYDTVRRAPRQGGPALPSPAPRSLPTPPPPQSDMTGATGPVDPWAPNQPVRPIPAPITQPFIADPPTAPQPPLQPVTPPAKRSDPPRVTRRLGGADMGELDARILAMLNEGPAPTSLDEAAQRSANDLHIAPNAQLPYSPYDFPEEEH